VGVLRTFSEAEITPLEPDPGNTSAGNRNVFFNNKNCNRSRALGRFFILMNIYKE